MRAAVIAVLLLTERRTGSVAALNLTGATVTGQLRLALAEVVYPLLLGGDPWYDAVALHRRLAYVPGDVILWPNLCGGEVIDLLGRLRGRLERFDLDPRKKGRAYSKGNRQKVALIVAA